MKLQELTGTKSTVVKIGEAVNTIKEFIKNGIVRSIKGKFYVESSPGSGLQFTGTAPSMGASTLIPPEPPYVPVVYTVAGVVTDLSVAFTVTPKGAGSLDFGDSSTPVTLTTTTNTATYVYATAGDYTATFTSANAGDAPATATVTTTDPVVAP